MPTIKTSFGTEIDTFTTDKFYTIPSQLIDIDVSTSGITEFSLVLFHKFKSANHVNCEIVGVVTEDSNWTQPVGIVPVSLLTNQKFTATVTKDIENINIVSISASNDAKDKPSRVILRLHLTQPLQEM